MRFLHDFVTLGFFFADVEQADARLVDGEHVAGDDRTHGGELGELDGRGLGVGAQVEHVRVTAIARGHRRHDGRAFHRGHGLQHEMRHRRERAGVAGTDHAARAAFLHEIDGDAHGGILALADGFAGMLRHADDAGRRMHGQPPTHAVGCMRESGLYDLGLPDEDDLQVRIVAEGVQRTRNAVPGHRCRHSSHRRRWTP